MPDGDSFLPRILSVFYAVFDVRQGPKIVYQVPEGLISTTSTGPSSNIGGFSVPPTPSRTLFNFNDISMFVIPHPALCGRLVTCSTIRHRIIGFPVELNSGAYRRNYFRFNLCFVFDRTADLSCYEPVVRKVSRVLKACEEESSFLSSEKTSQTIHAILEQLYEDLNSYSETSIPIDQFNSIELKIFPFYPNPPVVRDWQVPLALVNLPKRFEENWDLTVLKVSKFVNGVNHVSRIAHLADCDISLTREAIQHLLYYQVIMMIDIFQYSNMYTLCKSVQWLADESHVKEECGPYVTKPTGKIIPDWPKLLHLYSRLKPGRTIYEWMQTYEVEALGIDVRRFISFGVIKGFLRRVHRYPSTSGQIPHLTVPPGLKALLDGEHHTDELSVRFEAGWPLLEQWLRMIGGADNTDDYGRVVIIYK
ncbi:nitrogen permease regulator 2 [Agrocybe pediades]|nr:nitrogen permease regulator 2 [Agrocybe pediades]